MSDNQGTNSSEHEYYYDYVYLDTGQSNATNPTNAREDVDTNENASNADAKAGDLMEGSPYYEYPSNGMDYNEAGPGPTDNATQIDDEQENAAQTSPANDQEELNNRNVESESDAGTVRVYE